MSPIRLLQFILAALWKTYRRWDGAPGPIRLGLVQFVLTKSPGVARERNGFQTPCCKAAARPAGDGLILSQFADKRRV